MNRSLRLSFVVLGLLALTIQAQTTPELTQKTWNPEAYLETIDKLLLLQKGHVKGGAADGGDDGSRVFWWDSTGRARFTRQDEKPFSIGYRFLTIDFGTDTAAVPETLDEIRLAAGMELGEFGDGWNTSVIAGAGYSGDNRFASEDGLFGIGHLLFEKQVSEANAFVFGAGYDGNSSLFPDAPFPELALIHRSKNVSYNAGFPYSSLKAQLTSALTVEAEYAVPYSGEIMLTQAVGEGFSVFANFTNFFNAFYQQEDRREARIFYEMRRAEIGVRYENTDFIWANFLFDASIAAGYAFDQQFSTGWDVRDRNRGAELSDEPYIGVILRGTF